MLDPFRNPASWDNFRKVVVLVLILWAAVSAVLCIIYFFILGGRSPAPTNIFRALILAAPCLQSGVRRKKIGANDSDHRQMLERFSTTTRESAESYADG